MTTQDTVHYHRQRCAPHLARLRMLAVGPGGAPLRPCAVQQISEAADAILAEVRSATTDRAGSPAAASLLATRLTRLENAAHQMIGSVQAGNAAALREQIYRFDVLTDAIWTVHLSECERGRRAVLAGRPASR